MVPRRAAQSGMGLVIVLVAVMASVAFVMLMAYSAASRNVARTRGISGLGLESQIACFNAIEEAAYHFLTRSNSPRLSERDENVDLYTEFRDAVAETDAIAPFSLRYRVPPVYSRRLAHDRRVVITDVAVRLETESYVTVTERVERVVFEAFDLMDPGVSLPSLEERTISLEARDPEEAARLREEVEAVRERGSFREAQERFLGPDASEWCDIAISIMTFEPVNTLAGVVQFEVSARAEGPYNTVERHMVQRRSVEVVSLSREVPISIVRLSPNRVFTSVNRRIVTRSDSTSDSPIGQTAVGRFGR